MSGGRSRGVEVVLAVLIGVVLGATTPCGSWGQEAPSDWLEVSLPVTYDGQTVAGPGGEWILERAHDCQFILFGEQHGIDEIPQLVGATYEALYDDGFTYFSTEIGPWIANRLSESSVDEIGTRYPHSITFDFDPEIDLLRTVENRFAAAGASIWGLDQSSTAIHPLQRLVEIAPNHRAERLARGAFLKAALKFGEYSRQDHQRDLDVLREAFGDEAPPEAKEILEALGVSMEIFVAHRAAQRGEVPYSVSVETREAYMMAQLDEYLRAHRSGDSPPRAIFKMGGAHVVEGIGPNGVMTLGQHVQEIAEANGLDALNLGIRSYDPDFENSPPPEVFASGAQVVLVDTRSLRQRLTDSEKAALHGELARDIEGFDALIYIQGARRMSQTFIAAGKEAFRVGLLKRLALVGLPLLLSLSVLLPILIWCWRRFIKRTGNGEAGPFWPYAIGATSTLVAVGVLVLQILAFRSSSPDQLASLSTGLAGTLPLMVVGMGSLAVLALAALAWMRHWWGTPGRLHYSVLALGQILLFGFMYFWNLGGMLLT